ncbi:hypothetical protein PMALA_036830, partial [Plasmodium malariae]
NYMQDKDSSIMYLKEQIPRGVDDKNNIYNNEKMNSGTNKQTNGNSTNNKRDHKKVKKNKSSTFETKKYSHFEKKIFKDLDYALRLYQGLFIITKKLKNMIKLSSEEDKIYNMEYALLYKEIYNEKYYIY